VAAVVFAFGSRPGLNADDAGDLATLLSLERSLAGHSAAEKIREQAARDPDRGETSRDVQLDGHELRALAALLAHLDIPATQTALTHLRDELGRVQGRGVRFLTPELTTDVTEPELRMLIDELEKIAATAPPRPDVTKVIDELELHLGPLGHAPIYEPDDRGRAILLRATDHLRNLGFRGEILTLRDRLIGTGGAGWVAYRLRDRSTRVTDFTSYSLEYGIGDRVVNGAGEQLRVHGLASDDPHELWVEPWRTGPLA
jgi:hypothetical protein